MARNFLDHIAITAPSLEVGAAFVQEVLGVAPLPGGEHPRMGTHNRLLRLGADMYLEVIAPNPSAPQPTRPRWFALDALQADAAPSLSTWVVRTGHIAQTVHAASEDLGPVEAMSRGSLHWQITIPADGSVPLDGVAPALIEWPEGTQPAAKLPDCGLALQTLVLVHPEPDRVQRLLNSLALDAPVVVRAAAQGEPAHLVAHIATPLGVRTLGLGRL